MKCVPICGTKGLNHKSGLWKLRQLIPMWPKNEKLTCKGLCEISRHFQDWYFQDGDILLSTPTREKYGHMQEIIAEIRLAQAQGNLDAVMTINLHKLRAVVSGVH